MTGRGRQEGSFTWVTCDSVRQEYYEMRAAAFYQEVVANGGIMPPCPKRLVTSRQTPHEEDSFQFPDEKLGEDVLANHHLLSQACTKLFTGVAVAEFDLKLESSPDSSPVQSPQLQLVPDDQDIIVAVDQGNDDHDFNDTLGCNGHRSGFTYRSFGSSDVLARNDEEPEEVVSQPIVPQKPKVVKERNGVAQVRLPRQRTSTVMNQRVSLPRKAKDKARGVSCFCCKGDADAEQKAKCEKKKKSRKPKNSKISKSGPKKPEKKGESEKSLSVLLEKMGYGEGEIIP